MGPFRRSKALAVSESLEVEPLEVEPLDVEAWPVEVPEPRFADSCEFRLVGDDFALLWTRIPSGALARPAAAKLHVTRDGETVDVEPISFTVDPAADTVRFAFLVDRPVAKRPGVQLAITVPSQGRLELPPRVELPPFDSPDVAIESVLDATRAGDELVATT
ncbi:MAG: hypothetical protein QOJ07_2795, partial [Thermoleophilaceae bacterium]|nr:hypothetical protein [Thermoleophilaceae bacterium]